MKTRSMIDINKIASSYDSATFSLSFFRDNIWKQIMLNNMLVESNHKIIDLTRGTGDILK